jgi:hypothetical protein
MKQIEVVVSDGATAGNFTITGIQPSNTLKKVYFVKINSTGVTILSIPVLQTSNLDSTDITSEFSITAANTVNNSGGTNTTGGVVVFIYSH